MMKLLCKKLLPLTPSAGYKSIYPKTDGKLYSLDDAGNEVEIGSGAGGGGINYMTGDNSSADLTVGDWATYADAAATSPVDGTGGSATVTFARNETTPLRGDADFKLVKDAANRQGEGAGCAFSIDNADKAQLLTCTLEYDASHVGYADDDIVFSVYDVTNASLISINGAELKGGKGKHIFQFQAASDSTSYRLIAHVSSVNASAYDVYFDTFVINQRSVSRGAIVTDWKSYTPTISNVGTATSVNFEYRRVGADLEIRGQYTTGTVSGSGVTHTLPTGLQGTSSATNPIVGDAVIQNVTPIVVATYYDNSGNVIGLSTTGYAAASGTQVGNTTLVSINASVKIQGWSSNSIMSEDMSGREIAVEASGNDGESIAANSEDIPFKTSTIDTTTSWSNAGNTGSNEADAFTCPETGYYDVSGLLDYTTPTVFAIDVYIGGVKPTPRVRLTISNGSASDCTFAGSLYMEKGQVMTLRATSTITLGNTDAHRIFIAKRSSPQTILETETVAARYTSNTSTSIPHNTATTIPFEDIDYNTHGSSYDTSTGIYTVPVSGKYQINNTNSIIIGTTTANTMYDSYIDVEGTVVASDRFELDTSSAINVTRTMSNSVAVNLTKGQEVKVRIIQTASSPETLEGTSSRNTFSIARIK